MRTPDEWIEAYDDASSNDERVELRWEFRSLDGERLYNTLLEGHRWFGHLDTKNREKRAEQFPDLLEWLGAFGAVEDLARFEEWHQ